MAKGIKIIDNYNELSIGKYMDICNLCRDEYMEEIDRQVAIISILTDRTDEEILNLPIVEYTELVKKSRFLEEGTSSAHARISKNYLVGEFELIPATDINKITTAQYIDFQTFSKRGEDSIVELLSCFLIPKGKKYCQDYDVIQVQKAIHDYLSVSNVMSLSAFFLLSYRESMINILTFSRKKAMRMKDSEEKTKILQEIEQQERMILANDGDGSQM